jgi:FkbM family methyltransferase
MIPVFRTTNGDGSKHDDEAFWASAHTEYDLPQFSPTDVFLDIGCNIGGVSHHAHELGCRNLWAYEACPDNYALAKQNLVLPGVRLFHRAVVKPGSPEALPFPVGNNSFFIPEHDKVLVPTITLDAIVAEIGGVVRMLKIDVEGSEWEILYTFERYDLIDEIRGEYHEPCRVWWALQQEAGLPPYRWQSLEAHLQSKGFQTHFSPGTEDGILAGGFEAWR